MHVHTKLHSLLRPSTCAEDYLISIERRRIDNIGDWINVESEYRHWLHGDFPLLWVSGDPGSGKSYLAGKIISALQKKPSELLGRFDNILVGYFFFRVNEDKSRNFHQALRDMAAQIAQQSTPYANYLMEHYHSAEDIDTLESAWRRLFASVRDDRTLEKVQIYLIMDGLDEGNAAGTRGRSAFLDVLGDLGSDTFRSSNISLLLLGRPQLTTEVEEGYRKPLPMINMEKRQMKEGVDRFLSVKIQELQIGSKDRAQLMESLCTTIERKADGIILWADLILKDLRRKSSAREMLDCANAGLSGIGDVIGHILRNYKSNLDRGEQHMLSLILAWIYSAQRPLTLGEISDALTFDLRNGDSVFFLEQRLRGRFAGLINLTREDGLSTRGLKDTNVN
ncbi:hypothetical protein K491DRAFT_666962, partial [Lophiostoma macrostomum CBS 122681]